MSPGIRFIVFAITTLACACKDDCVWEVDDLLARAEATSPNRRSCGSFNSIQGEETAEALKCLLATTPGASAEFNVTDCTDCFIQSTYVITVRGELFKLAREADQYGDDMRTVAVERCAELRITEQRVECSAATEVYSCQESFDPTPLFASH